MQTIIKSFLSHHLNSITRNGKLFNIIKTAAVVNNATRLEAGHLVKVGRRPCGLLTCALATVHLIKGEITMDADNLDIIAKLIELF